MIIQTAYSGKIQVEESKIILFEHGIPGFEDETKYTLLPIEQNNVFHILQSIKTPVLAFIVTNPYSITTDYSFDIDEATVQTLHIQDEREVAVFAIVSLKDCISNSTINLKGPIVLNTTNNKAKQVILSSDDYSIRHTINSESLKR